MSPRADTGAPQVGPGEDCADPETGAPNSAMCSNGACQTAWELPMCSDAPVVEASGGTGVASGGA